MAAKLKVDGGFEPGADLGPVISPQSKQRIEALIASAEAEGATILLDGRGFVPPKYPHGNWVAPTVIADVTPDMKCYKEEIFGPVLVCLNAPTLDAAVALINANEYGNGTAIFTRSGATAEAFRRGIEAGQVGVNVPIPRAAPHVLLHGQQAQRGGRRCEHVLRAAGHQLLHAAQDGHVAVAERGCELRKKADVAMADAVVRTARV